MGFCWIIAQLENSIDADYTPSPPLQVSARTINKKCYVSPTIMVPPPLTATRKHELLFYVRLLLSGGVKVIPHPTERKKSLIPQGFRSLLPTPLRSSRLALKTNSRFSHGATPTPRRNEIRLALSRYQHLETPQCISFRPVLSDTSCLPTIKTSQALLHNYLLEPFPSN